MKILITGSTGYIGPVLVNYLRQSRSDVRIIGFDSGFFAHCLTAANYFPEFDIDQQYWGDTRKFPEQLLSGVDVVVHLAAVSNDPMGNRFEEVTHQINHQASINLAKIAKAQGVKSFVFASSCSMYGSAAGGARKEDDALNPLTAYARSKVATERDLAQLADQDFIVTSLRFATACGMSTRLRLDLVLNDFVACAVSTGEITVLSDGTPWRPLIDVKDMALAIDWAIDRPADAVGGMLAVNVGSQERNYQVKDLAQAVAYAVPGTQVAINQDAPPDKRSYSVDFSLYAQLAPDHQPRVTLQQSIIELKTGLERMHFNLKDFRKSQLMRLKVLEAGIEAGVLSSNLEWSAHRSLPAVRSNEVLA